MTKLEGTVLVKLRTLQLDHFTLPGFHPRNSGSDRWQKEFFGEVRHHTDPLAIQTRYCKGDPRTGRTTSEGRNASDAKHRAAQGVDCSVRATPWYTEESSPTDKYYGTLLVHALWEGFHMQVMLKSFTGQYVSPT